MFVLDMFYFILHFLLLKLQCNFSKENLLYLQSSNFILKCGNYGCIQTIIIFIFHELPNQSNSNQKWTFFSWNKNPFSIKPTFVWIKISEKGGSIFLVLNLFTFFKNGKRMVPIYQHLMLLDYFQINLSLKLILQLKEWFHVMFQFSNTFVGAGNLQMILYKFEVTWFEVTQFYETQFCV